MDFLLDPNIAYLFLLGAVLLAMMALVTPGSGFFEIGAFFCMALAGYAIYNLSFNWWALGFAVLSLAPFVYALQKPKRELYLAISIVLLIIGSVFIFPRTQEQALVSPLVALMGSIFVAVFLWIAVRKSLEAAHAQPFHSLDRLVGQIGEAKTRILDEGNVQVDGELWSARSEKSIPPGSMVRVIRREGFVLIVERNG
jgi:membrane-bound serine protease (ClpP class)